MQEIRIMHFDFKTKWISSSHHRRSIMSQLHNGEVPRYISAAVCEVAVPSFPEYGTSYIGRELCGSYITSFDTSLAASGALRSTYMSACNSASDPRISNGSPNGKLSSGSFVIATSGCGIALASTHPSCKGNPSSLGAVYPKVSEQISWGQETLPGVFDYPARINVSDQQNMATVSQQIQDSIMIDSNTHLAKRKEWSLYGSSGQFLENSGSAGSLLKAVDARSTTPSNYAYFHTQHSVSSPFNFDELCSDNYPSNNAPTKSRMRWTPELHEQFVDAVNKLGGIEKATPRAVQKVMKVEGLTIYHVKSHLQKYRTVCHRSESADGCKRHKEKQQNGDMETSEGLRTQIGLQKQLHEQLEIQRKLQLQVEEQSKYLEMVISKQSESLKQLGALPRFRYANKQVLDNYEAYEEQSRSLAAESENQRPILFREESLFSCRK